VFLALLWVARRVARQGPADAHATTYRVLDGLAAAADADLTPHRRAELVEQLDSISADPARPDLAELARGPVRVCEVRAADDLDAAFQTLAREHVAFMVATLDGLFVSERRRIVELAAATPPDTPATIPTLNQPWNDDISGRFREMRGGHSVVSP
jgi:hypothetical protein